ncbi:hypothetical protein JL722_14498 [Aureococcus anophagefferens]|nr:hypothetical protein JL722_14498 [Aureococcus anophagefferens]
MAFNAAVISERRPTSQRDRALEELDALLKGPKDRDGALTHLKEVTNSFIEKAAKKAGCRAALAPPSPTPGYADAAATDGPRAVALASGFLKTLGEDRCDYDTLREIVEKSAGAAR